MKDASRVLRLVNTVNSKSGEVCRVIHVEQGPDGEPIRYNFEYLAEALLPVVRWDIEADRKARADRRQFKLLPGGQTGNLRTLNGRQLAWDRLEDLRTLARELDPRWNYRSAELMTLYAKAKAHEAGESAGTWPQSATGSVTRPAGGPLGLSIVRPMRPTPRAVRSRGKPWA
ncbi:hypothetical protein [Aeromonas caviae]|uniref:hypothetical protein n=1 Tax=Aeromonas caviae TaxID=648 RepID=UPI001CC46926|nr:hypothetical protein [Aeromonas caviae]GJA79156.1 hypothetical protein KAM354_43920 [Aeromonas caviae]